MAVVEIFARSPRVNTALSAVGYLANGAHAAGAGALLLKTGTGTIPISATLDIGGDLYRVTATAGTPVTSVSVYPPLRAAVANNASVTSNGAPLMSGVKSVPPGTTKACRILLDVSPADLVDPAKKCRMIVQVLVGPGDWRIAGGWTSYLQFGPTVTQSPGFVINGADVAGRDIRMQLDAPVVLDVGATYEMLD